MLSLLKIFDMTILDTDSWPLKTICESPAESIITKIVVVCFVEVLAVVFGIALLVGIVIEVRKR